MATWVMQILIGAACLGALLLIVLVVVRLPQPSVVVVRSRRGHSFRFARASKGNRWFRARWLAPSVPSGDPAFDGEWVLETHDREFCTALLRRRDVRDTLALLAGHGCVIVEQTSIRLQATIRLPRHASPSEAGHRLPVRALLEALDSLVEQTRRSGAWPHRRPGWRVLAPMALMLLSFAAFMTRLLALSMEPRLDAPDAPDALMRCALLAGLPFALLGVPLVALLLKRHAISTAEFVAPLVGTAMSCVLLGFLAVDALNARLDPGPATTVDARIPEFWSGPGRQREGVYRVVLPRPRGTRDAVELLLRNPLDGCAIGPKSWVRVTTSPGWLGVERLLDVHVIPAPPAAK